MAKCAKDFGEYPNMIVLQIPDHMKAENGGYYTTKDSVCIDPCIVEEILELWREGIHTYNSCCGHGRIRGSVLVDIKSVDKMLDLGYENVNNANPELNEFYLKSKHSLEDFDFGPNLGETRELLKEARDCCLNDIKFMYQHFISYDDVAEATVSRLNGLDEHCKNILREHGRKFEGGY